MARFHFVRTLEGLAQRVPDRPLVASPERVWTAAELEDSARHLAGALRRHGVGEGDVVGMMLWNRPELLQTFYAALMLGAAPANINPRYGIDEVAYLLRDCAPKVVVAEADGAEVVRAAAADLADPPVVLPVGGEEWAAALDAPPPPAREPRPDDRVLVYTGGTTGRPKAVIWEVEEWYRMLWEIVRPDTDPPTPERVAEPGRRPAPSVLPCSPLAHGTALGLALNALDGGGLVVTAGQSSFDAARTLELVDRYQVAVLGIVGDAFGRPLADELEAHDWSGRLRSLRVLSSSGAIWTPAVRERLRRALPGVRLIDNYGSTEALITRNDGDSGTFAPRPGLVVLGPDDRPVEPGSGQVGVIATAGRLPVGYLNDPVKTAESFRTIDGRRHAIIGDEAVVEADGRIRILGRGNACINTGGEKVWPEEVERAVCAHPLVSDAVVVGVEDPSWGQRVVALYSSAEPLAADALRAFVRSSLAGYKTPKQWVRVPAIPRTSVGKPDYAAARKLVP